MYTPMPVLIVDDTAPFREMISSVLARRGHRITTAADGREALRRLHMAAEPHLVLLDLVMPVLDGIGVYRAIQADAELRGAGHRVILMSSSTRLTAPDVPPADGHLPKPFTRQQLITAVEAVCLA
jgi:CheY-like chemotaxis protein